MNEPLELHRDTARSGKTSKFMHSQIKFILKTVTTTDSQYLRPMKLLSGKISKVRLCYQFSRWCSFSLVYFVYTLGSSCSSAFGFEERFSVSCDSSRSFYFSSFALSFTFLPQNRPELAIKHPRTYFSLVPFSVTLLQKLNKLSTRILEV